MGNLNCQSHKLCQTQFSKRGIEKIVLTEQNSLLNQEEWPHCDYQTIITLGQHCILQNQRDVSQGVSIEKLKLKRRMKSSLETMSIFTPLHPIIEESTSNVGGQSSNSQFNCGNSTRGDDDSPQDTSKQLEDQCAEFYVKQSSSQILNNHVIVMQDDIRILKKFIGKQYNNIIVEPGVERQEHWDNLLEERSKDLWTLQCRRNKL